MSIIFNVFFIIINLFINIINNIEIMFVIIIFAYYIVNIMILFLPFKVWSLHW